MHYVPQFYLRNFSISDKLWCFDKVTSTKFESSIRRIAFEKYFYDQDSERYLSRIETETSPVYKKLVSGTDLRTLIWTDRLTIATFIAIQDVRTQEQRKSLEEIGEELLKRYSKVALKDTHESTDVIEKYIKQKMKISARKAQKKLIEDVKQLAEIILSLQWILCENQTEMLLWTSDNPISKWNPRKTPPQSTKLGYYELSKLGYLSQGIQMYFPLTPKLSLCLCDPGYYRVLPSEKIVTKNTDNIIFQNHLQVGWADRYIFSKDDDFSFAEMILKEEPDLKDSKRIGLTHV